MTQRILVIEDDLTMSDMLNVYLKQAGFQVTVARDGARGLEEALNGSYDLILLDVMLPNLSGWEVCDRIRDRSRVPIVLLTALDHEENKIRGMDLGADDYVTKPFSMKELLARVRARLRKGDPKGRFAAGTQVFSFPQLEIDLRSRTVRLAGQPLDMTPKEFDLLSALAREPGHVFTHEHLITQVWRYPAGTDSHTLRTHIQSLRRKLQGAECNYLHTVWGVGYKFEVQS